MELDLDTLEHRDGLPWYGARKPRKFFHRHRWQTRCRAVAGYWVERCKCGATQYSDLPGWESPG